LTLLLTCLFYKRPIDTGVLAEMNRIAAGLIIGWTALRFIDLLARGRVGLMFTPDVYGAMFWFETVVLIAGAVLLFSSAKSRNLRAIFNANLLVAIGGTVYRFAPPMLAFHPRAGAFYFPSAIEILIAFGFMSVAVVGFLLAIKKLAILPAPNSSWYAMERYAKLVRPEVQLTGYATAKD
jgi:Ni/Fe-hydrogenase subunit HybB-like protein